MEDKKILALKRKCEEREDGETVITLDKETALAMLRKLDACKIEQARVNTNNVELTTKLVAKTKSRDKWAATAWARKQRADVGELRITELETMLADAERQRELCNTLDDLWRGIPDAARVGDVPKDGKRYRVFFRSHVVEWEAGPDVWVGPDTLDAARHAVSADGYLPEPDWCWSCDGQNAVIEGTGGHCAECVAWIDGGMQPDDIEEGTRVRYYGIFGEDEHRAGKTRSKAVKNASGLYVVHVDLDGGGTIHGAHIRHLAPEGVATS